MALKNNKPKISVIYFLLSSIFSALFCGVTAFLFQQNSVVSRINASVWLFLSGVCALFTGGVALTKKTSFVYPLHSGFPWFSIQFRMDPLSGFFFFLIGLIVLGIALYLPAYLRKYEKKRSHQSLMFFTGIFVMSLYLVLVAGDVFSFMLAWELMAISSYFLVMFRHYQPANRHAGFVYFVMSHISALLILTSFGILATFGHGACFSEWKAIRLSPMWAHCAFFLAFFGFGMKAGMVPLHVWLPKAHPVAPSHISALMSGVMLKIAIYGFLRMTYCFLPHVFWQWGGVVLFFGTASALGGVLYAIVQHDLKKILAYHSVENIGIILMGIGLSMIFMDAGFPLFAALGLVAALYHCLNHAIFKSLLFLGAGAVLQQTHEHDLERMGGLIHRMPVTAVCFLIGCISISALPPFNGFVSEWLTFQAALQAIELKNEILRTILPVSAALLALTTALAATCFVKVFGIAFLGQPRTRSMRYARDPQIGMRLAMGFLSFCCLFFGIFPSWVIRYINEIVKGLLPCGLPEQSWGWVAPVSNQSTSYSAPFLGICLLGVMGLVFLWIRWLKISKSVHVQKPWECGFGGMTPRMQYTATAFSMPIRRIFKGAWCTEESLKQDGKTCLYQLSLRDWSWIYFYEKLSPVVLNTGRMMARLQGSNVRVYLSYLFFTLLLLLWIVL